MGDGEREERGETGKSEKRRKGELRWEKVRKRDGEGKKEERGKNEIEWEKEREREGK